MKYVVWASDLDSLYNDKPNAPVVHCKVPTEKEARQIVAQLQDGKTAAWFRPEAA